MHKSEPVPFNQLQYHKKVLVLQHWLYAEERCFNPLFNIGLAVRPSCIPVFRRIPTVPNIKKDQIIQPEMGTRSWFCVPLFLAF